MNRKIVHWVAPVLGLSAVASAQKAPAGPVVPIDPSLIKAKIEFRPELIQARKALSITLTSSGRDPAKLPKSKTPVISFPTKITGFYPRDRAPTRGTIVVEGTNLNSAAMNTAGNLFLGTTKLKKIIATDSMCVYETPETGSQTADLVLDDETLGGINTHLLASGYFVGPLNGEATITSITSNQGDNFPHANSRFTVRYSNIPTTILPAQLTGPLRHTEGMTFQRVLGRNVSFGGNVEPITMYKNGRPYDAVKFYGSEFTISFDGKYIDRPDTVQAAFLLQKLAFSNEAGSPTVTTSVVNGVPTMPAARATQDYVIERTGDLDFYLRWTAYNKFGTTEGKSDMRGVGGQAVDVGHLTIDGDAAFRITSGPLGTHVTWKSSAVQMNEGWYVKEVRWSTQEGHPAGEPSHAYVKPFEGTSDPVRDMDAGEFGVQLTSDQFLHADKESVWPKRQHMMLRFQERQTINGRPVTDDGKDPFIWFFRPMQIDLNADITLVNDHSVTHRLERVILSGPPNLQWQDGVRVTSTGESGMQVLHGDRGPQVAVFQPRP